MELQIEDLNESVLKKAYKKAVKKYHPDINSSNKNSEEIFKIISTAYKSLLSKIAK
jgi:DnaJ-class molecular chaperone